MKEPAAVGVLRTWDTLAGPATLSGPVVNRIIAHIDALNDVIAELEGQLEAAESLMEFNDEPA